MDYILNNLSPEIGVFETFDNAGNRAYLFDLDNFMTDSAVYMEADKNNMMKSSNLLLERELGEKVSQYLRNQNLISQKAGNVTKNLKQLKRKNAFPIKYFDDYVFIRQGEGGVYYPISEDLISRINELDREMLNRALEPKKEISVGVGDENSLSYIYCGNGVLPGKRGKFNIIHDNNKGIIRQMQGVVSNTRQTGETISGGAAVFQDRIGNWSFGEFDGFFRYLGKNTRVDVLTGMTADKTNFGRTNVGSYILEQSREGKSGLLVNIDSEFKSSVQIPGFWEELLNIGIVPSINPSIAYVNGNDVYKFLWLNSNGTKVSTPGFTNPSSLTIPSDYTTAALDGGLTFRVDSGKRVNLEVLAGAEYNKFSQPVNGEMKDNVHNISRFGIKGGYDEDNLKTSGIILLQNNSNVGRADANSNFIGNVQAGYRDGDYAGLINLYGEGFNNSNMGEVSLMISRYADKYLEHEIALKRMQAMYNARNANSLISKGTNNTVWDTPPVCQGAMLSFGAGINKFGENLCNAALEFYAGKKWSAEAQYTEKANDKKYEFKMKRTF